MHVRSKYSGPTPDGNCRWDRNRGRGCGINPEEVFTEGAFLISDTGDITPIYPLHNTRYNADTPAQHRDNTNKITGKIPIQYDTVPFAIPVREYAPGTAKAQHKILD